MENEHLKNISIDDISQEEMTFNKWVNYLKNICTKIFEEKQAAILTEDCFITGFSVQDDSIS